MSQINEMRESFAVIAHSKDKETQAGGSPMPFFDKIAVKTFIYAADDEEDEDTADAGVTDPTTRLFQMVKDRDYDDEEEEIVDDEDDGLMPLSEEPDEMKRVRGHWQKRR